MKFIFQYLSHLINGHIASLMGNLGGHDDGFAGGKAAGDGPAEAAVPVIGKAADAEGLNDKSVVGGGQGFQDASAGAGRKMGAFVAENLPENPVIGIVAHVRGSSTAAEREEGFRDGLGDAQSHVAATVFSDSDYEKAYAVTETLLETYPDMNVLVGLNEYSAVGAARAVRDMGRASEILMVGFDSSMEEIQMLEEGLFEAIVIQKPFNMGYLGVERTIGILHGELEPRQVDSGSELITKDNIYTEENQKLLFPFAE